MKDTKYTKNATATVTTVTTDTTVNSKSKELKAFIDTVKAFITDCDKYTIEQDINTMIGNLNIASSDTILLNKYIEQVDKEITLNIDNKDIKAKLVKLSKSLKTVKKNIESFRKKATNAKKLITVANLQDSANVLKSKEFFGWSVQVKKMYKVYELIGFSKNCRVFLLDVGDNEQVEINIQPLPFKSASQEQHFKLLCKQNAPTVKKAVNKWLGGVTKPFELDSIINVQRQLKIQEQEEKDNKKGEKLYNQLRG